ncbi:hypothetical protein ACFL27_11805 [candidate division CSSED10-310 bacterium]|uniref:Uncharacterized protein n=1 Tax=candidate division CSSED10-310 bacterium TaxID=2855610 RepID=A0ABV6YXD5_UNCC1
MAKNKQKEKKQSHIDDGFTEFANDPVGDVTRPTGEKLEGITFSFGEDHEFHDAHHFENEKAKELLSLWEQKIYTDLEKAMEALTTSEYELIYRQFFEDNLDDALLSRTEKVINSVVEKLIAMGWNDANPKDVKALLDKRGEEYREWEQRHSSTYSKEKEKETLEKILKKIQPG